MKHPNKVKQVRLACELTRDGLADRVGVTRQTIGLIENGRVSPSTVVALAIAKVLGTTVERLFCDEPEIAVIGAVHATAARHRIAVSGVGGRRIARSVQFGTDLGIFQPSHGFAVDGNVQVDSPEELPPTLFISGCDLALPLLANYLPSQGANVEGRWFSSANRQALEEFKRRETHVAGIHATGDLSAALIQAQIPFSYYVYQLSQVRLGWVVQRGNPHGFRGAADLINPRIRLVNRSAGAGARQQLEKELQRAGVRPHQVNGYSTEVQGHTEVVLAVERGFADVGITLESAATLHGLDFIPIEEENSVLLIPENIHNERPVQILLDHLNSVRFRADLGTLGPYETAHTGRKLALMP